MTRRKPAVSASSTTNSAFDLSAQLRRKALALAVSAAFAHGAYAQVTVKQVEVGSLVQTNPTATSTVLTHSTNQNVVSFYKFNTVAGESVKVDFTNGGSALYKVGDPVSFYGSLSANGRIFLSSPAGCCSARARW